MTRLRRRIERWLWSGGRWRTYIATNWVPIYFSDVDYIGPRQRYLLDELEHSRYDHLRPCKGTNVNVCVAEGCNGLWCVELELKNENLG